MSPNEFRKTVECHKCKETGHYANECHLNYNNAGPQDSRVEQPSDDKENKPRKGESTVVDVTFIRPDIAIDDAEFADNWTSKMGSNTEAEVLHVVTEKAGVL